MMIGSIRIRKALVLFFRSASIIGLSFALAGASADRSIAAVGDCGQPVTNGSNPTATDCLYILKTAVGAQTCNPPCICDVNAAGGVTATDALTCLKKAVGQDVTLDCGAGCTAPTTTTTLPSGNCTNDGDCSFNDDCVCSDCDDDPFCSDPSKCKDDGTCRPFEEGCVCSDCKTHPECLDN